MRKLAACLLFASILVVPFVTGALAQAPVDARVLAWEYVEGADDGQLEVLTSDGNQEVLVDFQPGVFVKVGKHCSQDIWAAEGQGVALFTGAAMGQIAIYPMVGGDPVALGDANRMACAGPATFQFSPNAQRVGFIDYDYDALSREFPAGDLKLFEAATGTQLATFDWATAFALYDDGALMLRLFPDGKGNATEADLDWWDGTGRRTLVTLEPLYPPDLEDVECGITSGAVVRVRDTAYVYLGQKCETGANNWRVVSVPMGGGAVTEISVGEPAGGYFSGSFTTQLIPAKDNSGFVMTIPSGLTRNTVSLYWLAMDGTMTPMLEGNHVLVDRVGERLTEGRHTLVSPDGNSLAFVTTTANNEQTLWMLDLTTAGNQPVQLLEQGINQRVFQFLWSGNSRLYFAAGSIEIGALYVAGPGETAQRLERGRFFRIAPSYNGEKIAAAEWFENPNSLNDDLFKLTILTTNGMSYTLKEGGVEYNQMVPLAIQ